MTIQAMRRSQNNKLKKQPKKRKPISNYIRNWNMNFFYLNKKRSAK